MRGRCCQRWVTSARDRTCNVCSTLSSADTHVPCVLQEMMHDEEDAPSAGAKPRPQDRLRQRLGLGGRSKPELAQGAVDPSNPESVKAGCKAHSERGQWAVWAGTHTQLSIPQPGMRMQAPGVRPYQACWTRHSRGCLARGSLQGMLAEHAPRACRGPAGQANMHRVNGTGPCLTGRNAQLPAPQHGATAVGLLGWQACTPTTLDCQMIATTAATAVKSGGQH